MKALLLAILIGTFLAGLILTAAEKLYPEKPPVPAEVLEAKRAHFTCARELIKSDEKVQALQERIDELEAQLKTVR